MNAADLLELVRKNLPPEYEVDDFLDSGGQGSVFRGRFRGQAVALKLFAPDVDPGFRRLDREVALLANIECPFLVKFIAHTPVTVDTRPTYLVAYELLDGGDLRQHTCADSKVLSASELAMVGEQVGAAIESLWGYRIVHRDVKPANIVRRDPHTCVLVDVGFARHVDRSDITLPGRTAGTPGYMSPEQASGRRDLTIRSDMFSLGVTLYELAAKRHPFESLQLYVGAPRRDPQPLEKLRDDLPDTVTRLIHVMLAPRVTDRPAEVSSRFRLVRNGTR